MFQVPFDRLYNKLSKCKSYDLNAKTILVNVSIPLIEIIKLKLQKKDIVIRLDGAYHDHINFWKKKIIYF